jgi:hypothetical protein
MTDVFLIPFVPAQPQVVQVSLNGVTYTMKIRWCSPADCWMLDLSDIYGNPILQGLPMITGADLLAQYEYLGLGFALVVQTSNDANAVPTFANMGTVANLYALFN